ncbi:DUF4153 domain-containing protein [Nocardioides campestrisoli]|uniref:DUF4153 domain-containing protein n=1 Tax=Nocardioides campestrisoli TaxID=2736757 RepID=UPI00163D45EC|nr:DUF4153 domain-containing protein [Nocardioides campestrisoli]
MSTPTLSPWRSIRTRLGVLVGLSVLVAALVAAFGRENGVPPWLSLPVTVLLALSVAQLLAAGMLAPLREMTVAAQRLAQGDHGIRVVAPHGDEVGQLASAFNAMADDLARVDAERRDLVATVSHELRTPVAALQAQLENLVDGVVPADERHLQGALDSTVRLGGLLADLLALSRLEAGVVDLDPVPVGLAALVHECADQLRGSGRPVRVEVDVPTDLTVWVDPARVRQLLVNVLDNAARHSPEGASVTVLAGAGADIASQQVAAGAPPAEPGWWLEVRDLGPGVPPADRERVFERFGTDPAGGGTGLGLAISRWVARLHGGTLRFHEPTQGRGARLRLELPARPPSRTAQVPEAQPPSPSSPVTSTVAPTSWRPAGSTSGSTSGSTGVPVSALDQLFGRVWPENAPAADLRPVAGALAVGVLAGALMTFSGPGLSWAVVLMLAGVCAWLSSPVRTRPFTLTCSLLAAGLVAMLAVRAADGLAVLGVLAAAGVFLSGVTRARTFRGFLLSGMAWPAAGLRGLPWFGRTLRLVGARGRGPVLARTVLLSLLGAAVFGLLFASADRTFARWMDALVPDADFDDAVVRGFVTLTVFAMTLAAAYLARNPARVDPTSTAGPVARSQWEWLAPLLVVDLVFAVFVLAQARVVLGGHDYVRRTAGLSYADYAHQGFGQLVVATALTLVVIWAAARRVSPRASDRLLFRAAAGLLGVLALAVVGAAVSRMAVYQDAYGFTTLRLVVTVFEAWLGLVVLAVLVLGVLGVATWVPRLALLTGASTLLGLLVLNPDAWVAGRNIDRYQESGWLDTDYLAHLSDDAVPVLVERLPADLARCVLLLHQERAGSPEGGRDGGGWRWDPAWTWGDDRAERALSSLTADGQPDPVRCQSVLPAPGP